MESIESLWRLGPFEPVGTDIDEADDMVGIDDDDCRLRKFGGSGACHLTDFAVGRLCPCEGDTQPAGERVALVLGDVEIKVVACSDRVQPLLVEVGADRDQRGAFGRERRPELAIIIGKGEVAGGAFGPAKEDQDGGARLQEPVEADGPPFEFGSSNAAMRSPTLTTLSGS